MSFSNLPKETLHFVGYPAMLALQVMKRWLSHKSDGFWGCIPILTLTPSNVIILCFVLFSPVFTGPKLVVTIILNIGYVEKTKEASYPAIFATQHLLETYVWGVEYQLIS